MKAADQQQALQQMIKVIERRTLDAACRYLRSYWECDCNDHGVLADAKGRRHYADCAAYYANQLADELGPGLKLERFMRRYSRD